MRERNRERERETEREKKKLEWGNNYSIMVGKEFFKKNDSCKAHSSAVKENTK